MLFEEIKQERAVNLFNATATRGCKKRLNLQVMCDNSNKIAALKESIDGIRREVDQLEGASLQLSHEQAQLRAQWAWFLRLFLRLGYYLRRGAIPVLEEMASIGYHPTLADLPGCLDDISKKCLLQEYASLASAPSSTPNKRAASKPKSKMGSLAASDRIGDVYKDTKAFMAQLVR
jgi:hypothetical protein